MIIKMLTNKITFLLFALSIFLSVFSAPVTMAHTFPDTCNSGSELYGWAVYCSYHQDDKYISFNHSLDSTYKSYLDAGVSRWNNTGAVSFTRQFTYSTNGYIHTIDDPDTSSIALFYNQASDSSGHLYRWSIKFNKYIMDDYGFELNATTVTHELGHAIGLMDLYTNPNNNKIMYGFSYNTTASTPTSSDITGALEATGQ